MAEASKRDWSDRPAGMQSIMSSSFRGTPPPAATRARPTSGSRHHAPHCGTTFRLATLPSGETVNVSATNSGDSRLPGGQTMYTNRVQPLGNSVQRSDYTGEHANKHAGNTRYGLSMKPWVDKAWQSEGVVPVVTGGGDMQHARTLTSTQDSYRAPFAPMDKSSTRAGHISQGGAAVLTSINESDILTCVSPRAQELMVHWIQSATGFEGEVIKRFLSSVSNDVAAQGGADAGWGNSAGAVTMDINPSANAKQSWNGQVSAV